MAEELLLLGALLDAANQQANEEEQEKASENWVVPCIKCDAQMVRMKGHEAYNTALNSTILCDGCKAKVLGTKIMFHCPKNQNLFHLNGFDFCVNCAEKHRDKSKDTRFYSNKTNNNKNDNSQFQLSSQSNTVSELKQEIDEHKRTINRLRNRLDKSTQDSENSLRALRKEKDGLIKEKRKLHNRVNDNLDIIDQQKEEIQNLKYIIQSLQSKSNDNNKSILERLQKDKLELQNKYRLIKQQLDDKLDMIAQYKEDINRIKSEKQINYTQGTKKNEISPTLKAIFTQKFFEDEESKHMEHKEYIMKLHNEILGMGFASHATIEWMKKKCRMYEPKVDIGNYGGGNMFSFNSFVDDYKKSDEEKPLINLKEFDLMTIQRLQKTLNILEKKYNECINSTMEWKKIIESILNPNENVIMDINQWKYWNYNNIVEWIIGLENGRYLKYKSVLMMKMGEVGLNGAGLMKLQNNVDLMMYGINDLKDQVVLIQHIDGLTGRKQKGYGGNNNKVSAPIAYARDTGNTGQVEGLQTQDIK